MASCPIASVFSRSISRVIHPRKIPMSSPSTPLSRVGPSTSVIVAAVVAMLGSGLLLVFSVLIQFVMRMDRLAQMPSDAPVFTGDPRPMVRAVWWFFLVLSLLGIVVGVGLLKLRNWAR